MRRSVLWSVTCMLWRLASLYSVGKEVLPPVMGDVSWAKQHELSLPSKTGSPVGGFLTPSPSILH